MKNIIKSIDNNNITKHYYIFIYLLLSFISFLYAINNFYKHGKTVTIIILICILIFEIMMFFVLKKLTSKKISPHNIFFIFVLIFGAFYMFGFPPSCLPDDRSDFLRALEVSDFHIVSQTKNGIVGREYSKNILKVYESTNYKEYYNSQSLKLNGEKGFMNFANKSLYAFVCYIPQAIGIFIARIFNLSIVFQMIFGKIFNFLLYVVLGFLSIKYIPSKKKLLLFILLLPISLQIATSLSPDCMLMSMTVALVSFVLWAKDTKTVFASKHYFLLSILLICLSLCKIVYLPLCFLILLIPKECFKTSKRKYVISGFILLLCVALNLAWLKISSSYLGAFTSGRGSDSGLQLKFILESPVQYMMTIFRTIDYFALSFISQMLGNDLGSFTVTVSNPLMIVMFVVLINLMKKDDSKKVLLSNSEKLYTYVIVIGVLILTFTALYLQWTKLYADVIDGVQGRYLLPLIPVLAMTAISRKSKTDNVTFGLLSLLLVYNIVAIISIYGCFI